MFKRLGLLAFILWTCCVGSQGDVLIVADEFPAMEYLAKQLKIQEAISSRVVSQTNLPTLSGFEAVVVYIHLGLGETAERAFIEYAQAGGRLVLLHHSISSGKRQNRLWFNFLGVELPQGDLDAGGYKWIEGIRMECQVLTSTYITTNRVDYGAASQVLAAFTLTGTEVYLNHRLSGPRT